ncbi:MAG: hypothetical protein R2838_06815 [Caldilineaceae bacterium]
MEPADKATRGTDIRATLKDDAKESRAAGGWRSSTAFRLRLLPHLRGGRQRGNRRRRRSAAARTGQPADRSGANRRRR